MNFLVLIKFYIIRNSSPGSSRPFGPDGNGVDRGLPGAVIHVVDEEVNQQDLDCSLNRRTIVRPNVRHYPQTVAKYYLNFDQREALLDKVDFDL